jgi:general stress protein YciG
MSGTSEGARKGKETNLRKNPEYYKDIRKKRVKGGGGFKNNPELARKAGKKRAEQRWGKKDDGEVEISHETNPET